MNIQDCVNTIGEIDEDIFKIQDKLSRVLNALESNELSNKDDEIYFVYERFVFNDGNNCDIDKNLLGCFKKYNSDKDCMNDFFTNIETKFPKEKLNRELEPKSCTCCGEIEGYGYWAGDALCEVSIYKCIPH